MTYKAFEKRYSEMEYRKCGSSGLKLPLISLGLWHNFGGKTINPESKKFYLKLLILELLILIQLTIMVPHMEVQKLILEK